MGVSTGRRLRLRGLFAVLVACSMVATSCGDDGGATTANDPPSTGVDNDNAVSTTADLGEPVKGGEATVLLFNEIASLDPVRMTGTATADGERAFALYGALVTFDPDEDRVVPMLAESLEPDADFAVWTLRLKPGVMFSDETPFNAEAVKVNWTRAKDPAGGSPSLGALAPVTDMTVVDDRTLQITLASPNAHFGVAISRAGANYIASPTALEGGMDLTSQAVGAGPFLLEHWIRDDRMVMRANPEWKGSDGPYLDTLTFRTVTDEDQRVNTFATGDADAFYTDTPPSVASALEGVDGATFTSQRTTGSKSFVFNTSEPPFNDLRMRMAFVQGVDWAALATNVFGEGAVEATNFTLEGTPWFAPDARLPAYDPDAAQALIDEFVADNGGAAVQVELLAFQQTLDQARARFIQASLGQLNNVNVEIEVNDSATNFQKVFGADYMVSSWGFPLTPPDPGVYLAAHSESPSNFSKYANPDVDAWIEQARVSDDLDERIGLYQNVFEALATDLPFYPYATTDSGHVTRPELHGAELFHGILRFDLLWKGA